MPKFVKLPNEEIVEADENGVIRAKVEVALSEIVERGADELLRLLSERATGSAFLTNIGYSIVGHGRDMLTVQVVGQVGKIAVEAVAEDDLPMREFVVTVTRVGYGSRTVRLSARTAEEAEVIADDDAGNHTYSEHASDYIIEAHPV